MNYAITIDGRNHSLKLEQAGDSWICTLDGREMRVDAAAVQPGVLSLIVEGVAFEIKRERSPEGVHIWVGEERYAAEVSDPRSLRSRRSGTAGESGPKKLVASMPGKVVRLLVAERSEVEAGQGVLVVEAMKMQNEIRSPKKGVVQKLLAKVGASVNAGDVLAIVD